MKWITLSLAGIAVLGAGFYYFSTLPDSSPTLIEAEPSTKTEEVPKTSTQAKPTQQSEQQIPSNIPADDVSYISVSGRTLSGSAPGFAKVQLRFRTEIDGQSAEAVQDAPVNANGNWTVQADSRLPGGIYQITLVAFKTTTQGSQGVILKEQEDGVYTLGN